MLSQFTLRERQRELIVEILKHKDPHLDISSEPSDSPADSEVLKLLPEEDRRYLRAHIKRLIEETIALDSEEEEDDSGIEAPTQTILLEGTMKQPTQGPTAPAQTRR